MFYKAGNYSATTKKNKTHRLKTKQGQSCSHWWKGINPVNLFKGQHVFKELFCVDKYMLTMMNMPSILLWQNWMEPFVNNCEYIRLMWPHPCLDCHFINRWHISFAVVSGATTCAASWKTSGHCAEKFSCSKYIYYWKWDKDKFVINISLFLACLSCISWDLFLEQLGHFPFSKGCWGIEVTSECVWRDEKGRNL